ncbi:serine hydrolase [Herbidospora sp. NEAU-GS84]|uniref:Serine hydrolase n=1 Tax=Herbidospora solisilvae TaxID=2696284 RepID=A0A7C9P385_9ACTN|nr:serine hydrolase [Herbidospora solisilvae]NAS27397.1 serine hydrolase [Herbidospora solisilvae]
MILPLLAALALAASAVSPDLTLKSEPARLPVRAVAVKAEPVRADPQFVPKPEPTDPPVDRRKVTRAVKALLKSRPGRASITVEDLHTGRVFRFGGKVVLPTASVAKVDILMALLRKERWDRLPEAVQRDAEIMIRYSDNKAADRLWERIGREGGLDRANRKFGLKATTAVPGRCVDLYCWGITRTTTDDQVRLLKYLPRLRDGGVVRRLMRRVVPEQRWGVSAGACAGERVALKNGWLKHVANDLWAITSVGLIGDRYAVAVLTEDNATSEAGIAKVERLVERVLDGFRSCPKG